VSSALDRGALDALLEVAGGDETFVDDLLETYLQQAAVLLLRVHTAVADGDTGALNRHAHTLKGASLNVGANGVARLCRKIENEAVCGILDAGDVTALELEVQKVREEI
jgi:HPt (histidine-containing phosphotransfer) domain-containing protein